MGRGYEYSISVYNQSFALLDQNEYRIEFEDEGIIDESYLRLYPGQGINIANNKFGYANHYEIIFFDLIDKSIEQVQFLSNYHEYMVFTDRFVVSRLYQADFMRYNSENIDDSLDNLLVSFKIKNLLSNQYSNVNLTVNDFPKVENIVKNGTYHLKIIIDDTLLIHDNSLVIFAKYYIIAPNPPVKVLPSVILLRLNLETNNIDFVSADMKSYITDEVYAQLINDDFWLEQYSKFLLSDSDDSVYFLRYNYLPERTYELFEISFINGSTHLGSFTEMDLNLIRLDRALKFNGNYLLGSGSNISKNVLFNPVTHEIEASSNLVSPQMSLFYEDKIITASAQGINASSTCGGGPGFTFILQIMTIVILLSIIKRKG